jgi:hypothetical protein
MMCPVVSCYGKRTFIANLYNDFKVALNFLVRFIDPVLGTLIHHNPVATNTWFDILLGSSPWRPIIESLASNAGSFP